MSFSVLILTFQEEHNIAECLDALQWCDDVAVLDSHSTDRTVEIARQKGAHVLQRRFDDFAGQRNFGMSEIPFKHDWVFHLDADERFTPELREECDKVSREDQHSGYFVSPKLMFLERWLKHSGLFPSYQVRLVKRGEFSFKQSGHGQREDTAKRGLGRLNASYLHYNFSKGVEEWKTRHARYAREEAVENLKLLESSDGSRMQIFSMDAVKRRRALKQIAAGLPFRSAFRFLYMYVLRLGFLDGGPGYEYCKLLAGYEGEIARHQAELKRQRKGTP